MNKQKLLQEVQDKYSATHKQYITLCTTDKRSWRSQVYRRLCTLALIRDLLQGKDLCEQSIEALDKILSFKTE